MSRTLSSIFQNNLVRYLFTVDSKLHYNVTISLRLSDLYVSDHLKRVPPLMRSLIGRRKTAVEEQVENRQLMNDILTRMSGLEAECTALRQMYHVRRIKIHEYIPVEDMAGLAKCFDVSTSIYKEE